MNFFRLLFSGEGFVPRAECGLWTPGHIFLHNASDFLIWTAYLAIPIVLIKFAYSRRDSLPFRHLFALFGLFILACGTTHLMDIVLFYNPLYRLSGLIKFITALASWGTVLALFEVVPAALQMKSPQELEHEIEQRQRAEAELQSANDRLEIRVAERTAELHHSAAELRASEQQFRLLTDASPQIVWTSQPDGHLDYFNQRWVEYTGMSVEETQGWGWEPVIHPEDLPACITAWKHSLESGEVYQVEYRFKRASDGTYRWHLGRALPLLDDAGEISKWFGTCTDIDDQKRAEAALRANRDSLEIAVMERTAALEAANGYLSHELEERKRIELELQHAKKAVEETARTNENMMKYSQDVICSISEEGRFLSVSPASQIIWGYSPEELANRPFIELVHPEDVALTDETDRGIAQGNSVRAFENRYVRKDGRIVHMLWSAVWSSHEKTIFCVARDISERKRTEAELRAAKEAAEGASLAKSQFLANMSHEIRTPMNGVLGPIGLLLDSELTVQQRQLTDIARFSAESLLGLINDILDLSKIEAGKLDIEPILFNLLAAVEETAGMMANRAEEKGLDLIVRYPTDVPRHVVGDPGRIRQVLVNLLSNAIKFTAHGHVLVNIEAMEQTEGDVLLRVSVEDSGIGIAPSAIEHVFGRFNQADTSTTRRYGGTGLGLSISEQLVGLMGGEMSATSTLGEGSTFSFTLRLPSYSAPHEAAPMPDIELGDVRVLVVDDNAVNRRVLGEQLESWDLRSESCAGAREALEALHLAREGGDPFGIAILDHQMPETDGEELGHLIKGDQNLRDTVLVMLTSLGHRGDASRLKKAGFAAHLLKPARQSEILSALVSVWSAHKAGRSDEPGDTPEARPYLRDTEDKMMVAGRETSAGALGKQWPGLRVLVVEDNIVNQKVAGLILSSCGCHFEVAADGYEALQMVETLPFDLIFMDCEMPEMDGYEATAAIRARTDIKAILPIIAVTAKATRADCEKCLQAGMSDYISKPVRAEDFQAALERWAPQRFNGDAETKIRALGETGRDETHSNADSGAHSPSSDAVSSSPTVSHPGVPALDAGTVTSLRALAAATDDSLLNQIFEAYLSDGQERLTALHEAIDQSDAEKLRQAAHAFKGASANIGALQMAQLSQQLQALGEKKVLHGAAPLVSGLEGEFGRVREAIAAEMESHPMAP